MKRSIKFPAIPEDEKAQLCFVRKYRQEKITRYIFYRANIKKKVSDELKKWMTQNVERVHGKEYPENTNPDNYIDWEYKNLDAVDMWKQFKEKAFTLASQEEADLPKIKNDLIAFIIYIQYNGEIVGHIRKITAKSLLDKEGFYSLLFDNSTFSELREERGITLDKYSDVVFRLTKDSSEGIVTNKRNFEDIFDIRVQQQKEAVSLFESYKVMQSHSNKDEIKGLIQGDRTLQRMLINPLVKDHIHEFDYETIKTLKFEVPDKFAFELDETSKTVIFPENNKKEAMYDFIKVISYKYSYSINKAHIVEGTPQKVIK